MLFSPIPMDLPHSVSMAEFRFATGHNILYGHTHCICVINSSDCVLCSFGKVMNFSHQMNCKSLSFMNFNLKNFYITARGLMADIAVA